MSSITEKRSSFRILLILTGGTIGTVIGEDGLRRLPVPEDEGGASGGDAEPLLLAALKSRAPELSLDVTVRVPYQVLSEHMTLSHLEKLAECLGSEGVTEYDGIFITHGSDTLAYTAAFLSELMKGCPVPVFLLATQMPLEDPESNGAENTLAAVQLMQEFRMMRGGGERDSENMTADSVYVPYRNSDGIMYLHRSGELRQCRPGTDDFFSDGMKVLEKKEGRYVVPEGWMARSTDMEGCPAEETDNGFDVSDGSTEECKWRVPHISLAPDVLLLHPYVGIRYDSISLEGVRAVLHTLYHSSTAPKELTGFLDRCREAQVPCYILPCDPEDCHYETTMELLEHGAVPLSGVTEESAYMKLLMSF